MTQAIEASSEHNTIVPTRTSKKTTSHNYQHDSPIF